MKEKEWVLFILTLVRLLAYQKIFLKIIIEELIKYGLGTGQSDGLEAVLSARLQGL